MTRIRLLRSAEQDLDSLAHVRAIHECADVREDRPVLPEWSLIARAAASLWTRRDEWVVTIGDAALCAASLAPRRDGIHVPVGTPTPRERALLTTRLSHARVLVATRTAKAMLIRAGVDRARINVVAIAPQPSAVTRADARRALGLDDATTVVHVPGTVRADSGHRLSLYACGILAYAQPTWRHLASALGDVGHAERFVASVVPGGPVTVARGIDEAMLAAAADVALFGATGVPERAAIDAALALGTPIVAPARLWQRERLPTEGVHLFAVRKAREVARAVLLAVEAKASDERPSRPATDDRGEGWSSILRASPRSRSAARR